MSDISKVVILIPSYEPDEKLPKLLRDMQESPFEHILIVNDGSAEKYNAIFDEIKAYPKVTVIGYATNRGKGYALKYGFQYILDNFADATGTVTADSDGQHTPEDIRRTAEAMLENPDKLILGSRNCLEENVPLRSRFGNVCTRNVFKWVSGTKVMDTQTGLRGFSPDVIRAFLTTKGDRFEYEMNMLMEAKMKHIGILEIPIKTIYIEDNRTSHFNPFKDSLKVYSVFIKHIGKFMLSSCVATVVDLAIFYVLYYAVFGAPEFGEDSGFWDNLTNYTYLGAFAVARVISSLVNFVINKFVVFKEQKKNVSEILRYYLVVIFVFVGTFLLESLLSTIGLPVWVAHILAIFVMFLVSYYFQRVFVFK